VNINSLAAWSGAIVALATLVVAVVTWCQLCHSRFALGVSIVLKLDAIFDAEIMRTKRRNAAKALKDGTKGREVEEVLDFFEPFGLLVRRKAIDKEIVWSYFSYWVLRYDALARYQIIARREEESDETYYQGFDYLVKVLKQIDVKKRKLKSPPEFNSKKRDEFLEDEIGLT